MGDEAKRLEQAGELFKQTEEYKILSKITTIPSPEQKSVALSAMQKLEKQYRLMADASAENGKFYSASKYDGVAALAARGVKMIQANEEAPSIQGEVKINSLCDALRKCMKDAAQGEERTSTEDIIQAPAPLPDSSKPVKTAPSKIPYNETEGGPATMSREPVEKTPKGIPPLPLPPAPPAKGQSAGR